MAERRNDQSGHMLRWLRRNQRVRQKSGFRQPDPIRFFGPPSSRHGPPNSRAQAHWQEPQGKTPLLAQTQRPETYPGRRTYGGRRGGARRLRELHVTDQRHLRRP
ncbi:unnamed protein product [Cuscuta epithymum]|uniref:Uncharacterized protein n=1 Tax=Cuscuta epithymum TaxID=186058 RepID=A0AAV0E5F0_9ASTE|nr:unnamed protein product [Cuscuta epithymum]CAH9130085.1 unnamed protein product [Cuscuta epithymum]